jgi:urea transporter/murein DD-endopeptidase MepM/ murein hydrolase activator NlpD
LRLSLSNSISAVYFEGIINSYSQIFFSNSKIFAVLLFVASMIDPLTGFSGLICLLSAILFAHWFGFDETRIRNGLLGFNALLTGLALGTYYEFSLPYLIVLILAGMLTVFVTIVCLAILQKYNVPYFTIPFLFVTWVTLLGIRTFRAVDINQRGIYTFNDLHVIGGIDLVRIYEQLANFNVPFFAELYLKALGAILFQYNVFAGLIVLAGLLIYSRIAFVMSLVGFMVGYLFFYIQRADFFELYFNYMGFNFILLAIAVGGFFFVASPKSFILVILVTPVAAMLLSGFNWIFLQLQLPMCSLPFNITMVTILLSCNNRVLPRNLYVVANQQYSPEKNLYKFTNSLERFRKDTYFHIQLPFFGEWFVSQGHDGGITHKQEWKHAWDFVVADDDGRTYRFPGRHMEDFYCNNLPVLAPAAGYVSEVVNEVDENEIGNVNIKHNWGNTVIIRHGDYLFSKLSHLKKDSIRVNAGEYVKRGDIIGHCGNSGRSPEPHIHFQLQSTPFVEAQTIQHPISYYIVSKAGSKEFRSFDIPREGETVSRVITTKLIRNAFYFPPGKTINFEILKGNGETEITSWQVLVDAYNYPYIYCNVTGSYAYFVNNETLHYFTDFAGDKNSLLYYFYLGANKVLLGYYSDLEIKDIFPLSNVHSGLARIVQDFVAPVYMFMKAEFRLVFSDIDNEMNPGEIKINSSAASFIGSTKRNSIDFEFTLNDKGIGKFIINDRNKNITAKCIA